LRPGDRLRITYEKTGNGDPNQTVKPDRISIYRNSTHLVSIARTDTNRLVYTPAPEPIPQIEQDGQAPVSVPQGRLPSTYDAIYRAALAEGLDNGLAAKLVRIFAFDVDFNSTISPSDQMTVFVSLEDGQKKPTEKSEILYTSIKLGSAEYKYYRYRDAESGRIDYFDETGKSAKKFLLRQPVPNGRFTSPFGSRWHPVLKYRKMHWGVDWAAPRGTPILAAGNGVVLEAGLASGYGKHTEIQHANGYITSYSHQSRIVKGIVPGVRVRQGQVIGYVGSTGLSTGPHCHYEVIVNGTKVDPMRIRLPKGRVLKGTELASYQAERDRIDDLLSDGEDTQVAKF
jgi:murein DD-endopeptidase MepM/ murein hydrolase activator NlpD